MPARIDTKLILFLDMVSKDLLYTSGYIWELAGSFKDEEIVV